MTNNIDANITNQYRRDKYPAILFIGLALSLGIACDKRPEGAASVGNGNSTPAESASTKTDAAPIIERYRALDNSQDSTITLRASISASSDSAGSSGPRQIQLTIFRKRQPDGRVVYLAEFTSPAEERDRGGLMTVLADGQIEGVRYVQSTDSFIVTRDIMAEDALFGMTLQELVDGQPEKYDFTIAGKEMFEGTPCFRADGRLKQGAESKFPRLVLLISEQTSAAVRGQFYDNHGEVARDLIVTRSEQVDGHWTRKRWTVDNRARGKKIDFEVLSASYDQGLKDSIFTREHVKRIASR